MGASALHSMLQHMADLSLSLPPPPPFLPANVMLAWTSFEALNMSTPALGLLACVWPTFKHFPTPSGALPASVCPGILHVFLSTNSLQHFFTFSRCFTRASSVPLSLKRQHHTHIHIARLGLTCDISSSPARCSVSMPSAHELCGSRPIVSMCSLLFIAGHLCTC